MKYHDPFCSRLNPTLQEFNVWTGEAKSFDFSNPRICYGSGGGTSTNTVTQSDPPPAVMAAYQQALSMGQSAAQQPLQQYTGNTVAPLTADQTSAFGTIDASQNTIQPYLGSASNLINQGTQPLWNGVQQYSPDALAQYQNPYTSQVYNAQVASEANTDAQQQSALQGNAISSGAWGGDRAGVASAVLSGQQDLANNSTNANILNTGFNQAQTEFNTQQQAQLGANEANSYLDQQGALGMASLGQTALGSQLQGASAQLQSGALQQQQAQEELNVPYQNYLQQQAYPFQTSQYFANIAEGLGANAGGLGSSSTTGAAPSTASQAAGLGTAGLGLYGAYSAANDAANTASARGGRIGMRRGGQVGMRPEHFAFGGLSFASPLGGNTINSATQIPNLSQSYVPSPITNGVSGAPGGKGPPQASTSTTKNPDPGLPPGTGLALRGGAKLLKEAFKPSAPDSGDAFSGAADRTSTMNAQNFMSPDGTMPTGTATPTGGFMPDAGAPSSGIDYGGTSFSGSVGDPAVTYGAAPSDAGAFGAATPSSAATAGSTAADTGGSSGLGALGTAAADTGAEATAAADALGATATDAAAADAATAALGAGATDAAAGMTAADLAPLLLLAARGGRIGAFGSRHYDSGGQVSGIGGDVGGASPTDASISATSPTNMVYNSSYQNLTPEQLQQLMPRLPIGSPQQQSAQTILQQKQMMPNVGAAPQNGFQAQSVSGTANAPAASNGAMGTMARGGVAPQHFADGGADGSGGIYLDGLPPAPDLDAMQRQAEIANDVSDETSAGPAVPQINVSALQEPGTAIPQTAPQGGLGSAPPIPQTAPQTAAPSPQGAMGSASPLPAATATHAPTTTSDTNAEPAPFAQRDKMAPWLALASAGFGIAGGTSPYAAVNIGRGAQEGMQEYASQIKENDTAEAAANKLMQEAKQHKQQLAIDQQNADTNAQYRRDQAANSTAERQKPIPDGMGGFLIPNLTDPTHPQRVDSSFGAATGGANMSVANAYKVPAGADGKPLSGDAYLATLPPQIASTAKQIANGDVPPISGFGLRNPQLLAAQSAAKNYDPTWNGRRYSEIKQFDTGKQGDTTRSFNVATGHLDLMGQLADALDTGDTKRINVVGNQIKNEFGLSAAPTNFDALRNLVSGEVVKATTGSGGALGDRSAIDATMSSATSPKILKSTISNVYLPAMKSQLEGLEQQFHAGTGLNDYKDRYLEPRTIKALGLNSSTSGAENTAPQTIRVRNSSGQTGSIPATRLQDYMKNGWQQVP